MVKTYFGNIREYIISELSSAEHDIYVAVAWITDCTIFEILQKKLQEEVDVRIVMNKDEINLNNGFDYEQFTRSGGVLYWEHHHHKFCVLDRKTVITGSYNWTYAAHNRPGRENIIIIKNEQDIVDTYSSEFRTLIREAEKYSNDNVEMENIEDDAGLEIITVYTVNDFLKAGFKLANQVRFNINNNPYLLCIDTENNKRTALYMFKSFGATVKAYQVLKKDEISIYHIKNGGGEDSFIIGAKYEQ